nr:hypothetical protein [Tanacetum cinerariifolium]
MGNGWDVMYIGSVSLMKMVLIWRSCSCFAVIGRYDVFFVAYIFYEERLEEQGKLVVYLAVTYIAEECLIFCMKVFFICLAVNSTDICCQGKECVGEEELKWFGSFFMASAFISAATGLYDVNSARYEFAFKQDIVVLAKYNIDLRLMISRVITHRETRFRFNDQINDCVVAVEWSTSSEWLLMTRGL